MSLLRVLILLGTLVACSQAAKHCACKPLCPLHDPLVDEKCLNYLAIASIIPDIGFALRYEPHHIASNALDSANGLGDWGLIVYPGVDLSQLGVEYLSNRGLPQTGIDFLRPYLDTTVIGEVAQDVSTANSANLRSLYYNERPIVRDAFYHKKILQAEIIYNKAVNAQGYGVCFVDLPKGRITSLVALAWGQTYKTQKSTFARAAAADWEAVLAKLDTSSEIFYQLDAFRAYSEEQDQFLCSNTTAMNAVDFYNPPTPTPLPGNPPPFRGPFQGFGIFGK